MKNIKRLAKLISCMAAAGLIIVGAAAGCGGGYGGPTEPDSTEAIVR
jgi:hypothetical protein